MRGTFLHLTLFLKVAHRTLVLVVFLLIAACGEFNQSGALGTRKGANLLNIAAKTNLTQLTVGSQLEIEANFDGPVEVMGEPGINILIGDAEKWAKYVSGSGTSTILFGYTVEEGLYSTQVTIPTDEPFRTTDSGYFVSAKGNKVTLGTPTEVISAPIVNTAEQTVQVDSLKPSILSLSANVTSGAYKVGDSITIYIQLSESISMSGSPAITLEMGATDRVVSCIRDPALYSRLVCSYTIQLGDTSGDLDLASGSIDLTGVTISDAAGNLFAEAGVFSAPIPNAGATGSLGANAAIVVDTTAPTITQVTTNTANGTYPIWGDMNSDEIDVVVEFSEPITYARPGAGFAKLELNVTNEFSAVTRAAGVYAPASQVSELTFSYVIAPADLVSDLNYASTTSLDLDTTTITDAAGNALITTLPGTGTAQSLAGSHNIAIDARSQVKQIAVSALAAQNYEHRCALYGNGKVICWGQNNQGQLGQGSDPIGMTAPGLYDPISWPFTSQNEVIELALGAGFTCARFQSGQVGCVGTDTSGQLGNGAGSGLVSFAGGIAARQIVAGSDHACAILADGTVQCWGDNSCGQLGVAGTGTCGSGSSASSQSPATAVSLGAGRKAVALSAGVRFTCALLDDASIKCWGKDSPYGQLGQNDGTSFSNSPVTVADAGDLPAKPIQISSGAEFTCALLANGQVLCWGRNAEGQLGVGTTTWMGDSISPMDASKTVVLGGGRATSISAGAQHACALLETGDLRCWGNNSKGQLGLANITTIGDNEFPNIASTLNLRGKAISVAAGRETTCALLSQGEVLCWGDNASGLLGLGGVGNAVGDNEDPSDYGPIYLGGVKTPKQITSGLGHNCALFTDGTAKCWGDGANGRLGYGNTDVIGDFNSIASESFLSAGLDGGRTMRFKQLAAGGEFTCGLLDQGDIKCWGKNDVGQLGLGNTTDRGGAAGETPDNFAIQSVNSTYKVKTLSAGKAGACAVLASGEAVCWGEGEYGQLGMGSGQSGPPPTLCTDDTDNCLGDNEALTSVTPKTFSGSHIISISMGSDQTCALGSDRKIGCVGSGFNGARGTGDFSGSSDFSGTSTINLNGDGALTVSTGENYSCSLLASGKTACWGDGASGRLGRTFFSGGGNSDTHYGEHGNDLPLVARIDDTQLYSFVLATFKSTFGLLSDSVLRGWGASSSADSTNKILLQNSNQSTPVTLANDTLLPRAQEVDAGVGHACALFSDGSVRCWGVGSDGELGVSGITSIGDAGTNLDDLTPITFY